MEDRKMREAADRLTQRVKHNPLPLHAASMVQCQNLSKEYILDKGEKVPALTDVSLGDGHKFMTVRKGEFVMIRGPSGGGKTTFLNMIGTMDAPSRGIIKIEHQIVDNTCSDQVLSKIRLSKLGIVFQSFNLISLMTALQNVQLPMRLANTLSEQQIRTRSLMLLEMVGLQDRIHHLPSELSGGEQQRVAIARALSNQPSLLLLDEPTGDLDSRTTIEVMNLLLDINNFGFNSNGERVTMIMVTHNPDLQCYAHRVLFFEDGRIKRQVKNTHQVAVNPQDYLDFLNAQK